MAGRVVILLLGMLAPVATKGQQPVGVYSQQNTAWQPNADSTYYLILKNNKNCISCFGKLYEYLKDDAGIQYPILCISLIDSSVFKRKLERTETQKLMPGIGNLYAYFSNGLQANNLFANYNVDITPAMVIVKGGKMTYYPYQQIFDKTTIKDFLHKE